MTQPELDFTRPSVGDILRDEGTAKVLSNNADYAERFAKYANYLLLATGQVTSDEVVANVGMPEGHPSAVGAAMRSFAKRHKLAVSRYVKSTRPSCHSAVIAVWGRKQQ